MGQRYPKDMMAIVKRVTVTPALRSKQVRAVGQCPPGI